MIYDQSTKNGEFLFEIDILKISCTLSRTDNKYKKILCQIKVRV